MENIFLRVVKELFCRTTCKSWRSCQSHDFTSGQPPFCNLLCAGSRFVGLRETLMPANQRDNAGHELFFNVFLELGLYVSRFTYVTHERRSRTLEIYSYLVTFWGQERLTFFLIEGGRGISDIFTFILVCKETGAQMICSSVQQHSQNCFTRRFQSLIPKFCFGFIWSAMFYCFASRGLMRPRPTAQIWLRKPATGFKLFNSDTEQ